MTIEHVDHPAQGRKPGQTHRTGYDDATRERLAVESRQIMARYPQERSALLPMLHLVQSVDGYVSPRGIAFCAQALGLTTAEVSAVATFYTQYKRHPNGDYTVGVCTNTLCAIMGGDAIWEELSDHLCVGHDETTEDGKITLERVECNAACDYAPVVMVNWEFFDQQTPESAVQLVDDITAGKPVHPTRGADTVVTFTEMSRVLAGFSDGRADEGPSGGVPTMRGTVLARENGWEAPPFPGEEGSAGEGSDHGTSATAGAEAHAPQVGEEQSSAERPGDSGSGAAKRATTRTKSDPSKEA
ncbi:NADH-quinone oxidoreductase subunit NuoE [Cellulomonas alba]|uniref:NADH-quinone oxidoreductase subunit NuoE n=1 Tax=Cellulomonas alba TaxID=3053467 RepID=A0ABT7SFS0_9CELL|nr:NADH-quinone oxidoreductase subunit NuoE [Cellulomonas alba]MDM7854387.1 NADH-quinone oxidoreductase subunit NuoE [Cellulomonas alba]